MRYSPEHKDETRTKVLRAAAAAMRARGPDGVGVANIMRSVGLTHGGFYAHFRNKDDLVAQAVAQMFADARRRWTKRTDGLDKPEALARFIDLYLSPAHRDDAARGCPLTSVAADIARGEGAARAAFDQGVATLVAMLMDWLPPDTAAADLATSIIAEMVGAITVARALTDRAQSGRLLAACRAAVRARAGLPAAPQEEPA